MLFIFYMKVSHIHENSAQFDYKLFHFNREKFNDYFRFITYHVISRLSSREDVAHLVRGLDFSQRKWV